MKKINFLIALIACTFGIAKAQVAFPRQDIHYNINYHWGMLDLNIARGLVTIQSDGNEIYGTLDGTSIPWEGKIFCVSDTLRARVNGLNETVTYQSGWYRRPSVSQYRSQTYNPDDPAYFKNIAGQGSYDASANSMEAVTVTSDMIGMYYYSHAIDFESMGTGEKVTVNIDGRYARTLVVTYNGKTTYTVNGDTYPAYDCTFEYSYEGRMSGYPVDCKIGSTDRIPLFLSANLPIGKIEMLYDPE